MLTSFTAIRSPGNIRNIQSNSGCLKWVLVTRVSGHSDTAKHTLQYRGLISPAPPKNCVSVISAIYMLYTKFVVSIAGRHHIPGSIASHP